MKFCFYFYSFFVFFFCFSWPDLARNEAEITFFFFFWIFLAVFQPGLGENGTRTKIYFFIFFGLPHLSLARNEAKMTFLNFFLTFFTFFFEFFSEYSNLGRVETVTQTKFSFSFSACLNSIWIEMKSEWRFSDFSIFYYFLEPFWECSILGWA